MCVKFSTLRTEVGVTFKVAHNVTRLKLRHVPKSVNSDEQLNFNDRTVDEGAGKIQASAERSRNIGQENSDVKIARDTVGSCAAA